MSNNKEKSGSMQLFLRSARSRVVAVILMLVIFVTTAFASITTSYALDIVDDGEVIQVATTNTEFMEIFDQFEIHLDANDRVDLSEFEAGKGGTITIIRAKEISINYFGELSHYEVYATTVAEAVEEAGLDLPEHVAINYGLDEAVFRGMVISIEEGDFVTVRVDGESTLYPIETSKDLTVAQLLQEKGIELGEDDIVTPELETVVEPDLSVSIERVTYEEVKEKETIKFSTTTKNSSELYKGETKVQTEGANGEKEITYRIQYVDGVETDKTVVKETTVTKAVTKVVLKGTKEESAAVMNSSSDSSRKWNGIAEGATISGTATHYCACAKCCGDKTVFTTASGLRVYTGMENPYIVACNWLPLGTKIRVNGTVYTVSDTGGSSLNSKGRIDIFVPQGHSAAVRLGKQSVTIEVLELAKTN